MQELEKFLLHRYSDSRNLPPNSVHPNQGFSAADLSVDLIPLRSFLYCPLTSFFHAALQVSSSSRYSGGIFLSILGPSPSYAILTVHPDSDIKLQSNFILRGRVIVYSLFFHRCWWGPNLARKGLHVHTPAQLRAFVLLFVPYAYPNLSVFVNAMDAGTGANSARSQRGEESRRVRVFSDSCARWRKFALL